ncbi:unnamed protein product [Adineta ricciae]|uniref:Uncharacterized protein n=1 Tax=Adineta ricciae TaxID=249248 RepID=A0A815T7P2_ADIRI|nr:unnamed protein product [Adineta ricciae]CAF1504250.1 unnamed protein product [Adineta ricciae]
MKEKKRSPLLTKKLRLQWARHPMARDEKGWKVVWSEEKKFNLDDPDGFSYCWHDLRKEEEILSTRPQGGGSVRTGTSFGWGGKSSICFLDGRVNSNGYRETLKNHPVNIGASTGGSYWIFQQDNGSVHRAAVNVT